MMWPFSKIKERRELDKFKLDCLNGLIDTIHRPIKTEIRPIMLHFHKDGLLLTFSEDELPAFNEFYVQATADEYILFRRVGNTISYQAIQTVPVDGARCPIPSALAEVKFPLWQEKAYRQAVEESASFETALNQIPESLIPKAL